MVVSERDSGEPLQVRAWREHRKLSLSELARDAGLSRMTLVRIERGDERAVRGAALDRLAMALGTTVDHLRRLPDSASATAHEPGDSAAS